jgi:hypothetical protein
MKIPLRLSALLLAALALGGCASGNAPTTRSGDSSAHCLGRPDNTGTRPLIYLLCIQTN